ncbi:PAS domain-containing protein, partial [Blyttiomyces helicus]
MCAGGHAKVLFRPRNANGRPRCTFPQARVITRPNPAIDLGPIDLSSTFLIVDAKKVDQPIVHASRTIENLTGYSIKDFVGRNCRFLQSPDGHVQKGAERPHVDNSVVLKQKTCLQQGEECQFININYRKGGAPFVNLMTIIPLVDKHGVLEYFVGFLVDLTQQSGAILRRLEDNSYVID